MYVTYAPDGRTAQVAATSGQGAVAIFNESGVLQQTIVGGPLAAPWGITVAPDSFGQFAGDLLVGNFSFVESEINAFDPTTGAFLGTIPIDVGFGNTPGGLWALGFRNRGDERKPRHPLLHRWHQRGEGWAVWCPKSRPRPHSRCWPPRFDLGQRRVARLVATAQAAA
jgi:hypothetical protein